MDQRRWAHTLNAALILTLVVFSVSVYGHLPGRIPMHYGALGEVDRWAPTTWGNWMMLPAASILMTCFFYGISALLVPLGRKSPKMLNMPQKEAFLRLTPEQREPMAAARRATGRFRAGSINSLRAGARHLGEVLPLLRFLPVGVYWFAVPMNANFLYGQWVCYRVALGRQAGLPIASIVVLLAAIGIIATWYVLHLRAMVREAAEQAAIR